MMNIMSLPLLAFFFITVSYILNSAHFLMSLLYLEGMMLSLVILYPSSMMAMNTPSATSALILLTFGACEASLGLSLLVKMSRHYGSDTLSNLTLNKC